MESAQRPQKDSTGNHQRYSWIMLSIFLWFIFVVIFNFFATGQGVQEISYTAFKEKVRSGEIRSVTMKGLQISGSYVTKESKDKEKSGEKPEKNADRFRTIRPSITDDSLLQFLEDHHVTIQAKQEEQSVFWNIFLYLLPWLLIIGFFVYASRKMGQRFSGAGGPFSFAKSKAKLYVKPKVQTKFEDVAGLENAKKELMEIVDFLHSPGKYLALGAELPKGVLLIGPPGVGKTLLARATAGEAGVTFFSISGSEFIEMFVGVGASRVRDMFDNAKKNAPAIIFIDELDSIGRVRGTGLGGGHDEREQTLNQILSEMDGFAPQESVMVMAATNRPDVLDPALVRPGRFDRQITLDRPHKEARHQILRLHSKDKPMDDKIDFEGLAARTVGFSGADLKNLVNEAVLMAARKNRDKVLQEDFEEGRDKIILGIAREDHINEDEKEVIACHEAGHTLMALLTPGADPIKKVTIIPHGSSLGATEQVPEEDHYNLGRNSLLKRLKVLLAGQVAEMIVFNDPTTGAGDDLKKATTLARKMILEWGMSEQLGPVAFQQTQGHPFLGRELAEAKEYSEKTAWLVDNEVRELLKKNWQESLDVLTAHRDKLDRLRQELLRKETLLIDQIRQLLEMDQQEKA